MPNPIADVDTFNWTRIDAVVVRDDLLPDVAVAFYYLCVCVVGGAIAKKCSKESVVSYSGVVFLEGVGLGLLHYSGVNLGNLSPSIDWWASADTRTLLYALLPCLVFGETIGLTWEYIRSCLAQCLFLAGPGIGLTVAGMAIFARHLPYDWDVWTCVCFGSILAATDPVASASPLQRLGCPHAFTVQLAGESIVGTSVAVSTWIVASDLMWSGGGDWFPTARAAGSIVVGGVVSGLLWGFLAILAFLFWSEESLAKPQQSFQLVAALVCAYASSCYFGSYDQAMRSGVLSTVIAALVISMWGKQYVQNKNGLKTTWETVSLIANTLVLFQAGTLCGRALLGEQSGVKHFDGRDFRWVIVSWLACSVVRGAMLLLSYPVLRLIGLSTNWKELIIMTWGGCRGAVAMALAVAVATDPRTVPDKGALFLFLVGGVVLLSQLVNATTSLVVAYKFGVADRSWVQGERLRRLKHSLHAEVLSRYLAFPETWGHSPHLMHSWLSTLRKGADKVSQKIYSNELGEKKIISPIRGDPIGSYRKSSMADFGVEEGDAVELKGDLGDPARWSRHEASHDPTAAAVDTFTRLDLGDDDLSYQDDAFIAEGLPTVRLLFYSFLREQYMADTELGKLPRRSPTGQLLLDITEYGACHGHLPVCDLTRLLQCLSCGVTLRQQPAASLARLWRSARDGTIFGKYCMPMRRGNAVFDLYAIVSLLDAHDIARQKLIELATPDTSSSFRLILREVAAESAREVEQAKHFLAMNRVPNELLSRLRCQQLAFMLLHGAEERVCKWVQLGEARHWEARWLLEDVLTDRRNVWAKGALQPGSSSSSSTVPASPTHGGNDADSITGASGGHKQVEDAKSWLAWWHAPNADLPLQLPAEVSSHRVHRLSLGNERLASYELAREREGLRRSTDYANFFDVQG